MNTYRIKFEIGEYDVEYFKRIAQECMEEAKECEATTEDFYFTVENEDGKWMVTIYENGSEVILKSGYVSFKGGILDKFVVEYKDTIGGILTQWIE